MITVFYDGKCGLCAKEIKYYKKIAPKGIFEWKDITLSSKDLEKEGISLAEGLKSLHAKDANGRLHKGVDSFILIWKQLKYWRILARVTSLPVIYQIANFSYKTFANWKFSRLNHCQLALQQEQNS
ncbi:MAG: DUF393 domain-containing protein [Pseudomonadota bacterium]